MKKLIILITALLIIGCDPESTPDFRYPMKITQTKTYKDYCYYTAYFEDGKYSYAWSFYEKCQLYAVGDTMWFYMRRK